MIKYLPLKEITASYEPEISDALRRIVERGWFLLGEECEAFEQEYASYIGSNHCIACGNGYDAPVAHLQSLPCNRDIERWG